MAMPNVFWLLAGVSAWAQSAPIVWVAPSLQAVKQTDRAGSGVHAQLFAGKGEYESFQIVIQAPAQHDLTNTNVTASELVSKGHVIPRGNLTLYREHYVTVSLGSPDWKKSNRPLGPGRYADALIPFVDPATGRAPASAAFPAAPFRVAAGTNQPVRS